MQVELAEANAQQVATFLRIAGIEIPQHYVGDLPNLLELHRSARLPDTLFLPDTMPAVPSSTPAQGLDEMFATELTDETERWMRIRLGPDMYGEDKSSIVPVSHKTLTVWLPRNQDVVLRERFVRVLHDARERRMRQAVGDGTMKFSEGEWYDEHRHPFSLIGVLGLVRDGQPTDLPTGVVLVRN